MKDGGRREAKSFYPQISQISTDGKGVAQESETGGNRYFPQSNLWITHSRIRENHRGQSMVSCSSAERSGGRRAGEDSTGVGAREYRVETAVEADASTTCLCRVSSLRRWSVGAFVSEWVVFAERFRAYRRGAWAGL